MKRWLSSNSLARPALLCLSLVSVFVTGCAGDREAEQSAGETEPSDVAASGTAATIDPARIEACGGFTVEDAADLLGVSVTTVTLRLPEAFNYETLKTCAFEDTVGGRGISYSLSWTDSVEEMIEDLQEERLNVGLAQTSIDAVMGEESDQAASYEIPGIGDEAFYAAVNGTVVARVGNVRVQVMNAPDLETRKAVAARVASRLR